MLPLFRQRLSMLSLLGVLVLLLAACGATPAAQPTTAPAAPTDAPAAAPTDAPAADATPLSVIATYSILGDLVANVAGDRVNLTTLVGPGGDPHVYEPTPRDSATLAGADLLFENGLEFESWLDDLFEASGSQATRVVVTEQITPLPFGGHSDSHDEHGHDDPIGHACKHFADEATAVTATNDVASAVAVPDDHTLYLVTLADGEGLVALSRDEDGDVSFFLGSDVPFAVFAGETEQTPEAFERVREGCDAIAIVYTFDLEPGDYSLRFGPGAGDNVALVWEEAGHDAEHGEGEEAHGEGEEAHGEGEEAHGEGEEAHGEGEEAHGEGEEAHGEGEEHGHDDDEHGHAHGEYDPHVWQDPNNARLMVETIRDALVAADPANAEIYEANATAYLAELEELANFAQAQVATLPEERRKLVTNHDTFAYFADRYGFEVVGTALGASTEMSDPSAGALAELVEQIRATGVPAIFTENTATPALMETLAREAGVTLAPTIFTDALGAPGSEGATYIDMIRFNVTTIVSALAE
jgi:ABC-type Zn uptake system ZnuABC Zn-binding protein ZnuA